VNRRAVLGGGLAVVVLGLYGRNLPADAGTGHPAAQPRHPSRAAHGQARLAAAAIRYARDQDGKPYLWGGAGPDAYDCSGLVMMAYRAAGITIPRTSQEQWAAGPQVTGPEPGDLVFFAGGDGTWKSPGHVAIVAGPARIVQAYAPGVPIGTYPYGVPSALDGTGRGTVIGYTRPWASA
jgi:cell wall-associated NlpC family hydrolase